MKLSGFFVAAMVITSVNAGLINRPEEGDINPQITEQSVTSSLEQSPLPASDLMSDAVQRQMDNNPTIKHTFKNDEYHNELIMDMYTIKEEMFRLANEIERICFKYIDNTEGGGDATQTKFVEGFNSDNIDYQGVIKLLNEVDTLFNDFVKFESKYLDKYSHYQMMSLS
ncbi:hypothetical protein BASA60_004350 [Batrachochytrium salamandrivorans]|nr:hypothetical protein BASA60_004350 [Batrachochytrium salamandrivorans]